MKPQVLTMQAFGSYGNRTVIDFTRPNQNLFLVTGDTGAGKTTIFDAIVFALYGEASSGINRKNGAELQSQFVSYDTAPFVELAFTEEEGGEERIYTVHRVPRHVRLLKRGKGETEQKETVSLTLPDGSEYSQNQKETDRKLEEIVGLSKDQFMQVAMIAQGEFMELLRAKSDDKKEIFRKLFHTELYQKIVKELDRRRKEKQGQMAEIRTICQTETAHTDIPEEEGELKELRRRILSADRLNAADMEAFLSSLQEFCGRLKEKRDEGKKEYERLRKERDEKRDAYTEAQPLLRAFEQKEAAETARTECEAAAPRMREEEERMRRILDAYEVKSVFVRVRDAEKSLKETGEKKEEQQNALPALCDADERAAREEETARAAKEVQLETFTKVEERVNKAKQVLEKRRKAELELQSLTKKRAALAAAEAKAAGALQAFEEEEKRAREEEESLRDVPALLERWRTRNEAVKNLLKELADVEKRIRDYEQQSRKEKKAQADYADARDRYLKKNEEYVRVQTLFLDSQAGYLAKFKLRPGEPCPVCGSLSHPNPCELSEEHGELSREMVERLSEEAAALGREQETASRKAAEAAQSAEEKKKQTQERIDAFLEHAAEQIPGETLSRKTAEAALKAKLRELEEEGGSLSTRQERLEFLRGELAKAGKKKEERTAAAEAAKSARAEADTALAVARKEKESLEAQCEFADENQADQVLAEALKVRTQAERNATKALQDARKAHTAREKAETLIRQFEEALPALEEELDRRRKAYEEVMEAKDLGEAEWKTFADTWTKEEAEVIRGNLEAYRRKKAAAEGAEKSAAETIAGKAKPDVEALKAAMEQAEAVFREAQKARQREDEQYRNNLEALNRLAPQMEERSRITREHMRLDSLCSRLGGKVTGGRMDIETFVQRYYLQRILHAANARFAEMSGGQFELRMIGEEMAGEGKNHGLDLMVYSTVTGKEREVRTLSGGESFLAALSLALGMADQIKETHAAIHPDVMFIDEGFGSLDDHARSQAVRVLQQMTGCARLIGIISHVTELKNEIEDQLLVTKDEEGSHVKWQIS